MNAGIRIGAFWIAANTMAWTGREQIQVFFSLISAPFHSTPSYLRRSRRQQFIGVHRLSIRGSSDGQRMLVFQFLTQSASDRVKNLNVGVRHPSKLPVIDGGRTPALKLLPSGLPQIRWHGTKEGEFSFFFS